MAKKYRKFDVFKFAEPINEAQRQKLRRCTTIDGVIGSILREESIILDKKAITEDLRKLAKILKETR